MKITRQNINERNSTSKSLWLREFAYDLDKNSSNIDYLKDYLNRRDKSQGFSSIEEKIADIKSRIGFDLARKVFNELEKTSSEIPETAEDQHCQCSTQACQCDIKTAQQHSSRDVELMSNILKYIRDMVKHEPHLDSAIVIARCRNEDGLRFKDLNINLEKLRSYIDSLLEEQNKVSPVSYLPMDGNESLDLDQEAEYYRHSKPSPS